MEIQIETHTLQRAKERGATESEIIETIKTGTEIASKYGRMGNRKFFHSIIFRVRNIMQKKN